MAEQLMSPEDLASELLNDRFDGDEMATTKYLLSAIDALPNADETKRKLAVGSSAAAVDPSAIDCDIGDIVVEQVSVSCTQPRGKLDITVGSTGILFAKDGASLFAVQGSVSHCIFFPKPSDCQKRWKTGAKLPPDLVMLYIDESITYKKKSYNQICFQLPDNATETWMERLQSVLQINSTERVYLRENKVFRSYQDEKTSSTTAGLPFVTCYHNVADGSLFFLKSGVFFYGSGMRFLPRGSMDAIQAVAGNRYVTLSVTLESDDDGEGGVLEFTNIHKVENDGIQRFIHKILIPAMQKDADGGDNDNKEADADEDSESGDNADPESDEDDGDNKSSRRKRKAANEALAINKRALTSRTEEEEDDDDDDEEDDADQNYEAGGDGGEEGDSEDADDDEEDYEDE